MLLEMLKLKRHKLFIKDFSKISMSEQHYVKYIVYLSKLLEDKELPAKEKDHQLKAEWLNFREFHISGDLQVIYRINVETLELIRIGTHSQLFR